MSAAKHLRMLSIAVASLAIPAFAAAAGTSQNAAALEEHEFALRGRNGSLLMPQSLPPGRRPAEAAYRFRPQPGVPRHWCPAGTSWQYGCVSWAPAARGQLFGACVQNAWSCKRAAEPIQ